MGAPTVTSNSYGFRSTGGTDATVLTSMKTRVKTLNLVASAANDTATVTDADGNAIVILTSQGVAGDITQFFMEEAPVNGLKVALSTTSSVFIAVIC